MSRLDESVQVLSVGSIVGGLTNGNRGWVDELRRLTREIAARRIGVVSDINVNVEFHIPGNFLTPEFDGVRTGYFRKSDMLLKVQVALPPDAPANPHPVLVRCMWDALDAVDVWAIAKRRMVDTTSLRELVAAVEAGDG